MGKWREEQIGDARLICGDALEVLPTLGEVDCLMTDPPYSSGGAFRGDRAQNVATKYVQTTSITTNRSDFAGDTRDQRSFLTWATMVFSRTFYLTRQGGACLVFTDWRQLPTMTDAVQCGGYVWRNIVTWWKPGIRMQRGRFSSSAEYVVYGTKGAPLPGQKSPQNVLQCAPVGGEDKGHIAEKPAALLRDLLGVTEPSATVLDPFMGSGSGGAACVVEGRKFIGIEIDPLHFETACRRIEEAYRQADLFVDRAPTPKPVQSSIFDEAAE